MSKKGADRMMIPISLELEVKYKTIPVSETLAD